MVGSLSLLLTIVTDEYLDRGETLSVQLHVDYAILHFNFVPFERLCGWGIDRFPCCQVELGEVQGTRDPFAKKEAS